LPGTIDHTAEAVTARSSVGVAVRCDLTLEAMSEQMRQSK
jgi:hypothetical protein